MIFYSTNAVYYTRKPISIIFNRNFVETQMFYSRKCSENYRMRDIHHLGPGRYGLMRMFHCFVMKRKRFRVSSPLWGESIGHPVNNLMFNLMLAWLICNKQSSYRWSQKPCRFCDVTATCDDLLQLHCDKENKTISNPSRYWETLAVNFRWWTDNRDISTH